MGSIPRRDVLKLLGLAGASLLGSTLDGCADSISHGSYDLPTPEAPLTPTSDFYVNLNFGLPPSLPSRDTWRLALRGLFDRPRTISFADLSRYTPIELDVTLECIGNSPEGHLISSARFAGVRLRDVLADALPSAHAFGLQLASVDGYAAHQPLEAGLSDEAMLAYAMNGEPLLPEHGAPVRALFPGRYGMFSAKWVTAITATRQQATWSALHGIGALVDGRTQPRSRIDAPRDGSEVALGLPLEVSGLAMTPGIGVSAVEVELEGAWQRAELTFNAAPGNPWLWTLWRLGWTPRTVGEQRLRVRLVDARGEVQPGTPTFPYAAGALHTVRVLVRA